MKNDVILPVEDNPDYDALPLRAPKSTHMPDESVVARGGAAALGFLSGARHAGRGTDVLPRLIVPGADIPLADGLGAASCIRKPVHFRQFIEAVRGPGLYWLMLNEPPPSLRERRA